MNTNKKWLIALLTALALHSCTKTALQEELTTTNQLSNTATATTESIIPLIPVCGNYVDHQTTDYYPGSYYQNYAGVKIGNDANNLYITLSSLNGFDFRKIKLVVGNLGHLQQILMPYTDPAIAVVGPNTPDYAESFTTLASTHTFTIPRTSLPSDVVYIYAWVEGEKWVVLPSVSWMADWRASWFRSSTMINSDPATSYISYQFQERPPQDCGQLRTQTPGGWGSKPAGNNPGRFLHDNFATVFPGGLTVGLPNAFSLKLATADDVTRFLPSGGQPKALNANLVNPTNYKNTLAGHLVALALSLKFDGALPNFGAAGIKLGQMKIGSGAFAGKTVEQFMTEANKVFGGAASTYSVQDVLNTATAINENYTDGTKDNGYLVCPNN